MGAIYLHVRLRKQDRCAAPSTPCAGTLQSQPGNLHARSKPKPTHMPINPYHHHSPPSSAPRHTSYTVTAQTIRPVSAPLSCCCPNTNPVPHLMSSQHGPRDSRTWRRSTAPSCWGRSPRPAGCAGTGPAWRPGRWGPARVDAGMMITDESAAGLSGRWCRTRWCKLLPWRFGHRRGCGQTVTWRCMHSRTRSAMARVTMAATVSSEVWKTGMERR